MDHGAEQSEAPSSSGPLDSIGWPASSDQELHASVTMHLSTRGEVMAWGYTIWFLGERISMGAVPVSPFENPHEALSAALAGIEREHGVQISLF